MNRVVCMATCRILHVAQPTPYGSADNMSVEEAKYWTSQLEEYYYQKEYVGENAPRTVALRTVLQKKGLLNEQ